jgi:site-specific recombinase XerD
MKRENERLLEECFRKARITGELCDNSIAKYQDSIKKFFSVISDKKIKDLSNNDCDNFIIRMKERGASNSRIANIISAVKWFIRKLIEKNIIIKNLDLEKIVKPRIIKKEVNYLTEQEIKIFLNAIEKEIENGGENTRKIRAMTLCLFLLRTGCRIGEVLSININDIDRLNKEVQITGKGSKQRTLFLTDDILQWIDRYLVLRKDLNKPLFVSLNGKSRWKQTDVGRTFRRYKKLSGIRKKFTIHTLRHTFATQYLMRGAGINVVQTALGHSDAVTTLKYYAGAVNKVKVKEMINDKYFDFMPELQLGKNMV